MVFTGGKDPVNRRADPGEDGALLRAPDRIFDGAIVQSIKAFAGKMC